MRIIDFAIANPVKVAVGVLLLSLFGLLSLWSIPVQLTPEVVRPTIFVLTRWPGASPQEIEKDIISKQEEQLQGIEGMVNFYSSSSDSEGEIEMEFQVGTDMSSTLLKVGSKLDQVPSYPEDADKPVILTVGANSSSIAYFSLIPAPPRRQQLEALAASHPELRETIDQLLTEDPIDVIKVYGLARKHPPFAELVANDPNPFLLRTFAEDRLAVPIENVPGVAKAQIFGGSEEEVRVVVDAAQLAARRISIPELRRALSGENKDVSAGDLWEGKRRYVIRTLGQYESLAQVENTVVAYRDGAPVYVRDIARVELTGSKTRGMAHQRGVNMLTVAVQREEGANVLEVMAGIRQVVAALNRDLLAPRGLYLMQSYDETVYIDSAVALVRDNIYIGGLLATGVLMLFLRDWRSTAVVAISIPISCIGTFLIVRAAGRSINVISLAGMSFAVGMLVDNSVVVLENIYSHFQLGKPPRQAASEGTSEVWGAVLASTLTTLAVFLPVIFIQEEAGQLFRDLAIAISAGVGISLVVSMTVVPMTAARLLRGDRIHRADAPQRRDWPSRAGRAFNRMVEAVNRRLQSGQLGMVALVAIVASFGLGLWGMLPRAAGQGNQLSTSAWIGLGGAVAVFALAAVVFRRWGVIVAALVLSLGMAWRLAPFAEYLPEGNQNLIFASLQPPPGYNIEQLMRLGTEVEERVRPYWEAQPGTPEEAKLGGPAIANFFLVAREGGIFMGARAADPERARELVPLLKTATSGLPGVMSFVSQASLFERRNSAGRSIDIEITGPELSELVGLGRQILEQVQTIYPPTTETSVRAVPSLDLASPEIHVVRRREKAAQRGINTVDLGYTVNALVDGAYAGAYWHQGKEIDLKIYGDDNFARRTQDIAQLPLVTPAGELVRIADVADVVLTSGPETINRIDRERAITIQVSPGPQISLEEAIGRIDREVLAPLRGEGRLAGLYQFRMSGTADKLRQMRAALAGSLAIALIITFLLIAGLYESFLYPLVIMISVPLGATGGVLALVLLNQFTIQRLDSLTMLGFVILIGTVVNNAILIVDEALILIRHHHRDHREAVIESALGRVRPIFMTTLTTVLGLLPLVVFPGAGSELYRGLGAVMLGGLLISTVFTLFFVPLLFSLTHETQRWAFSLLGSGGQHAQPGAGPAARTDAPAGADTPAGAAAS